MFVLAHRGFHKGLSEISFKALHVIHTAKLSHPIDDLVGSFVTKAADRNPAALFLVDQVAPGGDDKLGMYAPV